MTPHLLAAHATWQRHHLHLLLARHVLRHRADLRAYRRWQPRGFDAFALDAAPAGSWPGMAVAESVEAFVDRGAQPTALSLGERATDRRTARRARGDLHGLLPDDHGATDIAAMPTSSPTTPAVGDAATELATASTSLARGESELTIPAPTIDTPTRQAYGAETAAERVVHGMREPGNMSTAATAEPAVGRQQLAPNAAVAAHPTHDAPAAPAVEAMRVSDRLENKVSQASGGQRPSRPAGRGISFRYAASLADTDTSLAGRPDSGDKEIEHDAGRVALEQRPSDTAPRDLARSGTSHHRIRQNGDVTRQAEEEPGETFLETIGVERTGSNRLGLPAPTEPAQGQLHRHAMPVQQPTAQHQLPSPASGTQQNKHVLSAREQNTQALSGIGEQAVDGVARTTPEPSNAAELFSRPEQHRTPGEWAALLSASALPSSTLASPAAGRSRGTPPLERLLSEPMAVPTPLSVPARRFLRPLVGIDPAGVRVYRGAHADDVVTTLAADALAIGEDIVVSSAHTSESAETLGVLAHELTHVARNRDPRFVPPAVRHMHAGHVSEETLARSVEAQTIAAARSKRAPSRVAVPQDARQPGEHDNSLISTGHVAESDKRIAANAVSSAIDWGDLPAPWEPLALWAAQAPLPPAGDATDSASSGNGTTLPGSQPSVGPAAQEWPAVALAEQGRTIDVPVRQHTPTSEPRSEPGQAARIDLDALARQVYTVIKGRIAAERRRLG